MKKAAREFLVIVLGVFTALAGESFWSDSQDRRLAADYTSRLAEDLRLDVSNLSNAGTFLARVRHSGGITREWLAERDGRSLDQVAVHMMNAAQLFPIAPSRDTWDDLANTGRLALLPDAHRRAVARYYSTFSTLAEAVDLPRGYREAVSGTIPPEVWGGIRSACVVYNAPDLILPDCETDPEWRLEEIARAIADIEGVEQDLNRLMTEVSVRTGIVRLLATRAEEAIAVLQDSDE